MAKRQMITIVEETGEHMQNFVRTYETGMVLDDDMLVSAECFKGCISIRQHSARKVPPPDKGRAIVSVDGIKMGDTKFTGNSIIFPLRIVPEFIIWLQNHVNTAIERNQWQFFSLPPLSSADRAAEASSCEPKKKTTKKPAEKKQRRRQTTPELVEIRRQFCQEYGVE